MDANEPSTAVREGDMAPHSAQTLDVPSSGPTAGAGRLAKSGASTVPALDVLLAALNRSTLDYYLQEYVREFQPVGHLEWTVVHDLTWHTVAVETCNEGLGALHRQQARRLPELVSPLGPSAVLKVAGSPDDGETSMFYPFRKWGKCS
jgi:hypothetical protein